MRLDGATDLGPIHAAHSSLRHRSGLATTTTTIASPRLLAGGRSEVRAQLNRSRNAGEYTQKAASQWPPPLTGRLWKKWHGVMAIVAWTQANDGDRNAIVV